MGYHVHFQVAQLQPTNCLDHMPTALSYHRKNPPEGRQQTTSVVGQYVHDHFVSAYASSGMFMMLVRLKNDMSIMKQL